MWRHLSGKQVHDVQEDLPVACCSNTLTGSDPFCFAQWVEAAERRVGGSLFSVRRGETGVEHRGRPKRKSTNVFNHHPFVWSPRRWNPSEVSWCPLGFPSQTRDAPVNQPHTDSVTGSVHNEEAADVDLSRAQKLGFSDLGSKKTIQSYRQHKSLVSFHLFGLN